MPPVRPAPIPSTLALAIAGALATVAPPAVAQAPAPTPAPTAEPDAPARTAGAPAVVLQPVVVNADALRTGKDTLRATRTRLGKGDQDLRDVPQSITVVTEQLIDDRHLDTLKDTLRLTAGVAFQAAEGSDEDIRLRGFSLQATGDIFRDGLRDPAFYERDSFDWDRLEVLRGSASMLFGRGSTGGAVNQVSKQPRLMTQHEVSATVGSGDYLRATGDFNWKTGTDAALRVNVMGTTAQGFGVPVSKHGLAPTFRWGIGRTDEFSVGLLHLRNDNGIHYGLPWLTPGTSGGNWLWPTDPRNFYGMGSDSNRTGTTQGTATHVHRFDGGSELRTTVRLADHDRDQRASAIRFAPAAQQPGGVAVTADTFSDATVLTRGTNNKTMGMRTAALQSDWSGQLSGLGVVHGVQAGVDAARERFENKATTLPPGITLTKPVTRVGTPDDGASLDESLRIASVNRRFEARALGVYAQDLVALAPTWKVLAGVRWDRFEGRYDNVAVAPVAGNTCSVQPATTLTRTDSLWSHRMGLLWQPDEKHAFHASYGTSFNTSGDTYQFDAGTARTGPESSRNLELGGRIDSANGRFTSRVALFHTTKYNERNRDTDTVDACNYVLSGQRHAAGFELDLAGRLTAAWEVWGSYAWIPVARVDASSGAAGTEPVGARPGLTPRHSGSIWTAVKLGSRWRLGAGLNARSSDRPVGLAATSPLVAPSFVTADLMAEHRRGDTTLKLNVTNLTDAHTAETLYRAHYVPGKPRTVQLTLAHAFD